MKNTGRKTVKGTSTSEPMVAKSSSKSPKSSAKASSTGGADRASPPSHEQIAMRSFEIYLSRGATPGHELYDWLQAVHELQG